MRELVVPTLVALLLGGCRPDAPLIRVDAMGAQVNGSFPVLVLDRSAPGPLTLEFPPGTPDGTLDPEAGTATYAAAGGDLVVRRYALQVSVPGDFALTIGKTSVPFSASENPAASVLSTGLQFYAAQRCGPDATTLHGACHLYSSISDSDAATSSGDALLVPYSYVSDVCRIPAANLLDGTHPPVNVEGGWHDAGDYLKFTHTTAFTVALLFGTYLRDPTVWPDDDGDGTPDLLTTMEPGVRWLIAAHPDDNTLIYQVGDERDHDYWRMPEDDTLSPIAGLTQRPAYVCGPACANIAGRASAALALAAQAYVGYDDALAATAKTSAISLYNLGVATPGVQPTCPADFYPEDNYADDMQLAAAALYGVTTDPTYLADAVALSNAAGTDEGPPAYADVQVLADAWLARQLPAGSADLSAPSARAATLRTAFAASAAADPTGWAGEGTWGSVATAEGYANACAWLVDVDSDESCGDLSRWQVHSALGMNPFGVPYMVGLSDVGPLSISSPLTDVSGQAENGAVVGGPASQQTMDEGGINAPKNDAYADLQTPQMIYHDNVNDYVSNEAALDYTAQLLSAVAEWDR